MPVYEVYASFIVKADSEEDATGIVYEATKLENVDQIWVADTYEEE